jgi:hypothetical protein
LLVSCCGTPSLTRGWVCNILVQLLLSLASAVTLGSNYRSTQTIFYCLIRHSPNLEGQVPVFMSPKNRVAQLYPRELGSLFVASYDSQGYRGGILTRLHMRFEIQFKSHGTHGHILLSHLSPPPQTWRARSLYFYPPGTRWPSYNPEHWVPFLSPLTTRRDCGGGILTRLHTGKSEIFLLYHI